MLTFYLIAPFILRRGIKIIVALIVSSFLLRLFIFNYLGFQNDPWTYRFFPTEIMFFLFGYLSYQIHLRLRTISISKFTNLFTLFFIIAFIISYPYVPSIELNYSPFSVKELIYFSSLIVSIPLLFNFLKRSKIDNQIGELSYPVYISHMLVFFVCSCLFHILPFILLKESWVISIITIIAAYSLNQIVAFPIEKYRQSRLKK
jgi:peptidoglycan/LPS O-acetylase OafA/YrhL